MQDFFVQSSNIQMNDITNKGILSVLSLYFTLVDDHIQARKQVRDAIANVERKNKQFCAIQRRIFSKKSQNNAALSQLLERTYELVKYRCIMITLRSLMPVAKC